MIYEATFDKQILVAQLRASGQKSKKSFLSFKIVRNNSRIQGLKNK